MFPQTMFAVATAPLHDCTRLPQLMLWTWLHVLQCALANQSLDPEEDAVNKPDRPIPSGRITVQQTRILRWACLIPCLAFSAWYSVAVVQASAALAFFVYVYNELQLNSHWLGRSVLNGAGLACFEMGATLIAGRIFFFILASCQRFLYVQCCRTQPNDTRSNLQARHRH